MAKTKSSKLAEAKKVGVGDRVFMFSNRERSFTVTTVTGDEAVLNNGRTINVKFLVPVDSVSAGSSPTIMTTAQVAKVVSGSVTTSSLVEKLAATVCKPRGKVAGYTPTEEQVHVLDTAEAVHRSKGPRVLVVIAGAGAGKTSTQKMLEQVLPGRGQYTAFNSALVADSKSKFVRAHCNTTHSLAFRAVGSRFAHRLNGPRIRSDDLARLMGIEPISVTVPDGIDATKVRVLQPGFLAGQVMVAIKRFCQTADLKIEEKHFRYINGIDQPDNEGRRGWTNNNLVIANLIVVAERAWADLNDPNGRLPYVHDYYVKSWQLGVGGRPHIAADYILLDEAQDTAPVFLDILKQQDHATLVFVGDSNQAIYEWRGAVDAMKAFPDAARGQLSQSFRFGQTVADVANAVLARLSEPTDLVLKGLSSIPSRIAVLKRPRCTLCRTNAGAVGYLLTELGSGRRGHLVGGGADVVAFVKAARDLKAGRQTSHPELCCFSNWTEVEEYAKTDEGEDFRLLVRLVKEFGVSAILEALEGMPEEDQADFVVSTAHKSKGREWPTVKLGPDFPTANRLDDAGVRLLYVAVTRTQEVLDISECPPFVCTIDPVTNESIKPIEITYTTSMPTETELESYRDHKAGHEQVKARPPASATQPSGGTEEAKGDFSWANVDGGWKVRGAPNQEGKIATVTRRDGSTAKIRLGEAVKKSGDLWYYTSR